MQLRKRTVQRPGSTGVGRTTRLGWLRRDSLPPVLASALPRRLAIAALMYAIVFALNVFPGLVAALVRGEEIDQWSRLWVSFLAIGLALAMWLVARRGTLSTRSASALGLVLYVAGAFGIAVASIFPNFPDPSQDPPYFIGLPWTCVWLTVYPMVVPTLPRWTILGGLMIPGAVIGAVLINLDTLAPELPMPKGNVWASIVAMHLICLVMAVMATIIIHRLGTEVASAQRRGSYELERLLGRGGMGEVWLGRHLMLARAAAVKLIRPEALSGDAAGALRRFEREAQATARLNSPHSIEIYDFGTADDGTFYYVMEFLEGIDLETLVERHGPVEPERVVHWLRHACHSLAEAHAKGLIHRDIKPANLYACHYGLDYDFLKVLDFGLVKSLDSGDVRLTEVGAAVTGTPAYMPPEVATGEGLVDGRADLYALGCVAYFLLTGQLVFSGTSAFKVLIAHVQETPTPPSERTELKIPSDLEALVMELLAKRPDQRPANALELDARLARLASAGAWSQERAQTWWQRHHPDLLEPGSPGAQPLAETLPRVT